MNRSAILFAAILAFSVAAVAPTRAAAEATTARSYTLNRGSIKVTHDGVTTVFTAPAKATLAPGDKVEMEAGTRMYGTDSQGHKVRILAPRSSAEIVVGAGDSYSVSKGSVRVGVKGVFGYSRTTVSEGKTVTLTTSAAKKSDTIPVHRRHIVAAYFSDTNTVVKAIVTNTSTKQETTNSGTTSVTSPSAP